ncbi:replication-relaxation family protein [Cytobacillus massiliigabonensis]|uniref:replication-relaxation family protein n=1 Tax=Cytobacillus massiliigabonensis TaxID=1871011 RepID=UPI001F365348|nr:replication-relaxation family protein [Cytobacillus massiliigabonensis]
MKKQQRMEEILLSLKKCDFLSREQLQKIHKLGQDRNAQRVLSNMEEYLSHFLENRKKIYYLNAAGRELVQAEKKRTKNTQVNHYLMRNDLYIAKGKPSTWQNEVKITINDISLIADAAFISNKLHHFIEIDFKQSMAKNIQKIKRYKKLSTYNPQFALIWVTTTPYRKKKLQQLCEGLKIQIYLWEDLK